MSRLLGVLCRKVFSVCFEWIVGSVRYVVLNVSWLLGWLKCMGMLKNW